MCVGGVVGGQTIRMDPFSSLEHQINKYYQMWFISCLLFSISFPHNPLTPFLELACGRHNKLGLTPVPFFLIGVKEKMKSLFG